MTAADLLDQLAAIEDGEAREARRASVAARRAALLPSQYALKFQIDTDGLEPTDANIEEVLKWCALRPRVEWYPAIRAQVLADRAEACS